MDRTQFDRIMAMPLPQVGERYRLTEGLDRYPNFTAEAGSIGTITDVSDYVYLTMDDYVPGCEEWANAIIFQAEDFDSVEYPDELATHQVLAEDPPSNPYGVPARAFLLQAVERVEDDQPKALAAMFCHCLRLAAKDEEWDKMREDNRTITPGACASHDFCDANMVMAEAFEIITGHELADDSGETHDADVALWNAAWAIAKQTYFTLTDAEAAESAKQAGWEAAHARDDQEALRALMETPPRFLPLDRPLPLVAFDNGVTTARKALAEGDLFVAVETLRNLAEAIQIEWGQRKEQYNK